MDCIGVVQNLVIHREEFTYLLQWQVIELTFYLVSMNKLTLHGPKAVV